MKLKERLKNIKTIELFLILCGIWLLDIVSTIYALNFSDKFLVEANKFASFWFSFGPWGYLTWIFVGGFFLFLFCSFIVWSKNYISIKKSKLSVIPVIIAMICFGTLEIMTIINNLILIIR